MFERKHKPQAIEGNSMDIDMTLNVRPNADFQLVIDPTVGDIIKGRGEGTLNLHINPRSNVFEMYGDYTITEGSYLFTLQNIINKRFIIENGSTIQWTASRSTRGSISMPSTNSKPRCNRSSVRASRRAAAT